MSQVSTNDTPDLSIDFNDHLESSHQSMLPSNNQNADMHDLDNSVVGLSSPSQDMISSGFNTLGESGIISGAVDNGSELYSDFLKDLLFTSPEAFDINASYPKNTTNFALFDFWDPDVGDNFETSDFANVPFSDIPSIPTPNSASIGAIDNLGSSELDPTDQMAIAAGGKAFSTSVWHWVPESSDNRTQGQADLAPSSTLFNEAGDVLAITPETLSKKLVPTDRDRVLSILLAHCERNHVVRVASAFPSYQIMEKLMHAALHFQTVSTVSWLHIPTFSPHAAKDELLAALVACGAFLSPIAAAEKLGTAMIDIVFCALVQCFEKDNASTRSTQLWQCYLTILNLMFWSGSKRIMEIGESQSQPLITMLRRSGAMANGSYRLIVPTINDTAQEIDLKWQAWVEQETRIRIVHHVLRTGCTNVHDSIREPTHISSGDDITSPFAPISLACQNCQRMATKLRRPFSEPYTPADSGKQCPRCAESEERWYAGRPG